jgi:hypothetical protein
VQEEPLETIHLYVVREKEPRPSLLPLVLSILVLLALLAIGILIPYKPLYVQKTIRVPAIFLPLQSFSISVPIIPTGEKTYPATTAHGTLTIYNGSILSQELPQGMILTGIDNVEVMTDEAAAVPAGNPPSYGIAHVSVHAVVPGRKGNIATLDINQVYGTSLYIRNLQAFTGGQEAHTVTFIMSQDRQNALSQARQFLIQHTLSELLQSPCRETVTGNQPLSVTWTCQFVTYAAPPGKVLHAEVAGKVVILDILFMARPPKYETK